LNAHRFIRKPVPTFRRDTLNRRFVAASFKFFSREQMHTYHAASAPDALAMAARVWQEIPLPMNLRPGPRLASLSPYAFATVASTRIPP
jgi:hypothetical protein